jgi:hypothetical protein
MTLPRRLGRFRVAWSLLSSISPELLTGIFERTIVVRAESMYQYEAIDYVAYHPDFELLTEGEVIPLYECLFHSTDRSATVEWRKAPPLTGD